MIISLLNKKGDYITSNSNDFSMKDVSIMSKETGVEFAKVTIGNRSYLIRGDRIGTDIPDNLIKKIKTESGSLEFHSHPHNDDCVPSAADCALMNTLKRLTGQRYSTIVTPNGRTSTFDEHGVISTGTVSNQIDDDLRNLYIKMLGGN